jgi:hypothetical protein
MKYIVTNPLIYFFGFLFVLLIIHLFTKLKWYWLSPFIILCAVSFYFLTPKGANFLVELITNNEKLNNCKSDHILVRSDGLTQIPNDLDDYASIPPSTFTKFHRAKYWLKTHPESRIIISGISSTQFREDELGLVYNYALSTGLTPSKIIKLESSSSPVKIARTVSQQLGINDLAIIASDIEMKRLRLALEKFGVSNCFIISKQHSISAHPLRMLTPSAESIAQSETVLWEFFGILWYWWNDEVSDPLPTG